MERFKRRVSAPTLSLTDTKASSTKSSTARRQSEGLVEIQRPVQAMPKYYMRGIDRETAERLLMSKPAGTFLVRNRQSSDVPGLYTLSMRDKTNQCRHFKVDTDPHSKQLTIYGYPDRFKTLDELVAFFVNSQKREMKMKPFGQDELYEYMDDDVSCYQDMEPGNPAPTPPTRGVNSGTTPSVLSQQASYENIGNKQINQPSYENIGRKGRTRQPPPPSLQQQDTSSPPPSGLHQEISSADKTPHNRATSCGVYQNIPPKNDTTPTIPPRRKKQQMPKRQGSLPSGYENTLRGHTSPPPPLPTRTHLNSNYQNMPGRDASTNHRRPKQYHRSLTQPNA